MIQKELKWTNLIESDQTNSNYYFLWKVEFNHFLNTWLKRFNDFDWIQDKDDEYNSYKFKHLRILNVTLYKTIEKYNLLIKSTSFNNGLEFKALGLFGYQTGIAIYKYNSYASHKRSSNENANCLIRKEHLKSTGFSDISNKDIEYRWIILIIC